MMKNERRFLSTSRFQFSKVFYEEQPDPSLLGLVNQVTRQGFVLAQNYMASIGHLDYHCKVQIAVRGVTTRYLPKKKGWYFGSCRFTTSKYVGVQSWTAAHLPTVEIRVEQKGNRVKKREKNGGKKKNYQSWLDRESNPGPVDNWPNVCFDKSGPLEDTV